MNRKPYTRHSFRCFTALALAFTFAACSGGSGGSASPTGPSAGPTALLSTQWGDMTVETNGHPVNFDKALDSVNEGYERARGQVGSRVDGMRLDGYKVVVMPATWELNGQHLRSSREIRMRAGIERVLVHELQHLFAWELDRFSDCKTQQDHPQGFDLHCRRLS